MPNSRKLLATWILCSPQSCQPSDTFLHEKFDGRLLRRLDNDRQLRQRRAWAPSRRARDGNYTGAGGGAATRAPSGSRAPRSSTPSFALRRFRFVGNFYCAPAQLRKVSDEQLLLE